MASDLDNDDGIARTPMAAAGPPALLMKKTIATAPKDSDKPDAADPARNRWPSRHTPITAEGAGAANVDTGERLNAIWTLCIAAEHFPYNVNFQSARGVDGDVGGGDAAGVVSERRTLDDRDSVQLSTVVLVACPSEHAVFLWAVPDSVQVDSGTYGELLAPAFVKVDGFDVSVAAVKHSTLFVVGMQSGLVELRDWNRERRNLLAATSPLADSDSEEADLRDGHDLNAPALPPLATFRHRADMVRTLAVWTSEDNIPAGSAGNFYNVALADREEARMVSAGWNKDIRLWDLKSTYTADAPPLAVARRAHTENICCATFTPDGRRVITGAGDHFIKIWDGMTLDPLATLDGHTKSVRGLSVGLDGSILLSASLDQTVRVWDLSGPSCLSTFGVGSDVDSCCLSADNRLAIAGARDKCAHVWDLSSGERVQLLTGHSQNVNALSITDMGRVFTASESGVVLWGEVMVGTMTKAARKR